MSSRRKAPAGMTRRKWTAGLTAAVAAAMGASPATAQVTSKIPPEGTPAPAQASTSPEQKLQKAYSDVRQTSDRLSKIEIPMDVEPAFAFRP